MTTATIPTYGDLERTELPSGAEVFYRDSDHSYWRGAKKKSDASWGGTGRLTGVSTVCSPFDFRPDNLLRWVERLTLEGVSRGFRGREVPADPHVLRSVLESNGLRWEQIRDAAGERGTNVHQEVLHALAAGEDVPDLGDIPPDQRGAGQAVMKWWLDHDPEPLNAEQVIYSAEHGFAGRLDLRCRVTRGELDDGIWLIDLKTGGYISTKAHAQVAGYDLGVIESELGDPADKLVIVQACEDGTYNEIPVCADHDDFLAALNVYRRTSKINSAANAARKVAEAARA